MYIERKRVAIAMNKTILLTCVIMVYIPLMGMQRRSSGSSSGKVFDPNAKAIIEDQERQLDRQAMKLKRQQAAQVAAQNKASLRNLEKKTVDKG